MIYVVNSPFTKELAKVTHSLPRMDGLGADHSLGFLSQVRTLSHSTGLPTYFHPQVEGPRTLAPLPLPPRGSIFPFLINTTRVMRHLKRYEILERT